MRVVIDTNIFFSAFNPKSYYHPIIKALYSQKLTLLVSTSVLLEYEEILERIFPKDLLEQFWLFLLTSDNVIYINPTYSFQLPEEDGDDQKFVDCAVCGNADYLITNDKHFNSLKSIEFPKLNVIKAEKFLAQFLH